LRIPNQLTEILQLSADIEIEVDILNNDNDNLDKLENETDNFSSSLTVIAEQQGRE
jgi:antitoxin component of MazEF toxin-antitoxin module